MKKFNNIIHLRFICLFLSPLLFFSCSLAHRKLDNGKGNSVPKEGYAWTNQSKFDSEIYQQIDPDFLYELVDEYWCDNNFKKVKNIEYGTLWKKKLQFYPNGQVRRFASKMANANPEITGNRGVIYKERNEIKIDFFEGVSNNRLTVNTYLVQVKDNKIYMFETSGLGFAKDRQCLVFEKNEVVNTEYKNYKAEW